MYEISVVSKECSRESHATVGRYNRKQFPGVIRVRGEFEDSVLFREQKCCWVEGNQGAFRSSFVQGRF